MQTQEALKRDRKLRLFLMEEGGAGEDPTIWEMDYNGSALPGDPRRPAEKLHAWLSSHELCACRPRRHAKQAAGATGDDKR